MDDVVWGHVGRIAALVLVMAFLGAAGASARDVLAQSPGSPTPAVTPRPTQIPAGPTVVTRPGTRSAPAPESETDRARQVYGFALALTGVGALSGAAGAVVAWRSRPRPRAGRQAR